MGFCDKGGAAFSSETNEWSTPQDLFEELNEEFGFTIDVAATAENAKCERYYTAADNGLKQSWGEGIRLLQSALRPANRTLGGEGGARGGEAGNHRRSAHPVPNRYQLLSRFSLPARRDQVHSRPHPVHPRRRGHGPRALPVHGRDF